ncbi:NADH-quinone oxidoreductase subunit NuoE [Dehalococcoidia bacterium]|nr:NADH-quinone oxidoreductase subunit NuoE [Dehalococcoidia bacterium]
MSTEEKEALDRILASHKRERAKLIPILQEVQVQLGYLPEQAMLEIAEYLQIDGSAVYGVATFYNQFRLTPPGKHPVKVCMGTACHMKGGTFVLEAWERELNIKVGETTPDGEFSLERVACVGCCTMAPVTVFEETVHGKMTPARIEGILAPFRPAPGAPERGQR